MDGALSFFFVVVVFCFPVEAQEEGGDKGMMRRRGLVVRALDLSSGRPGFKSCSLTLDGLSSVFK